MNKTKKIAIFGANGFIGKNLAKSLGNITELQLTLFSHKPIENQHSIYEIEKKIISFDFIIFLLNSNNKKHFNDICNLLEFLSKYSNSRIILISSLSVDSKIHSKYVLNKIKLENIVKKNPQGIILRVGFVHSSKYSSYQKIFGNLKTRKFLIVPGGNYKTGFITINSLSVSIYKIIVNNVTGGKIIYLINEILPINLYLRVRNFRGILISIPLPNFSFCSKLINCFVTKLPSFIQSFLVLSSYNSNIKEKEINYYFLKKIFLFDYFNFNRNKIFHKKISIKYYLINYAKFLANEKYLCIEKSQKFLYHIRLNELLNLREFSNRRNYNERIN